MPELPTDTLTFLFTDIEGSTRLWEQHPDASTDGGGKRVPLEALPLVVALTERRPAHSEFQLSCPEDTLRHVAVTAFPILDDAQQYLGAMAILWEVGGEGCPSPSG